MWFWNLQRKEHNMKLTSEDRALLLSATDRAKKRLMLNQKQVVIERGQKVIFRIQGREILAGYFELDEDDESQLIFELESPQYCSKIGVTNYLTLKFFTPRSERE